MKNIKQTAQVVLNALDCPDGELSILLVDDSHIAELNSQYLNRSGPTNVIAFPIRAGEFSDLTPDLLGDVVISLDTAASEALAAGIVLEQRIREVVSWVQLESRLYDRVGTLSHGLQQRASIARAILHNPSILFLDEPEVGLDLHVSTVISDVLNSNNSNSRTVVMTTHNLERGLELSDNVIILDRGEIVYQAIKDEIDTVNFRQLYDHYTRTGK